MPSPEVQQEFEALLNPATENAEPAAPTVEQIEYYLGDKASKLPVDAQFAFNEGGKITKTPLSTMINHYRQRADLDKRNLEFKKTQEDFKNQYGDIETYKQQREKYGALQDWSEKNPEEFQRIWELYQNKDQHLLAKEAKLDPANPLLKEIAALKQELYGFKDFKANFEKEQEEKNNKSALAETQAEADAFSKEYPEIKLDEKNADGIDLYRQVMVYGMEHGFRTWKDAAVSMLYPKLQEVLLARGRNEAVKGVRFDKAAGVIARSSKPFGGQSSEVDPRKLSWSDAKKAAKAEFEELIGG